MMCAVLTASMSACSVIDSITGDVSESASVQSQTQEDSSAANKTVDSSIALPVFNNDLNLYQAMAQGSIYTIDGTAVSTDGGEVTYQWYVNNVSSNGGGTAIEGATDPTYTVDASETGFKYYYVVASNNHGDSYNMVTSGVAEIEVIQSGEWVTDEFGGTRYVAADGSYPTDRWLIIGTDTYWFDSNGYRLTGWRISGDAYVYFDDEGRYHPGEPFPEGAYFDENGNYVAPAAQ